jgi:drug/metabolite transporter (DMT)-like permease
MFFLLLLPFGSALAARLRHRDWRVWAVWGGASLIAFVAFWIAGEIETAAGLAFGASVVGFLGPELWHSCRGFVRQPKVFGALLALAGIVFLAYNQQYLKALMLAGLAYIAYRIILRPLVRGGGR